MKVVSRHVYLGDLDRFIDRIKTNAYAFLHSLIDFSWSSRTRKRSANALLLNVLIMRVYVIVQLTVCQ